jgi:hypothetical protein
MLCRGGWHKEICGRSAVKVKDILVPGSVALEWMAIPKLVQRRL